MPVTPAAFAANAPVTASVMNSALYTAQHGNATTPTGILFHVNRPVLVESLTGTIQQQSSSAGVTQPLYGPGNWKSYFDSSMLFGPGADAQFDAATGQFNPQVMGTGGIENSIGGIYVTWGFPAFGVTTNAGGSGAGISENQLSSSVLGGMQLSSTVQQNCSYALDAFTAAYHQLFSLEGYCADASGHNFNYAKNEVDYSGNTTRFYGMWVATGTGATVSAVPVPPSWNATSTVTSSVLNNSAVTQPLLLLNNPPVLRAGTGLATSIPATGTVTVPVANAQVDTYGRFSASGHAYNVPLNGVYLAYGVVQYASGSAGALYAGIQVNSSVIWGPAYSSAGTGPTGVQVVKLLDLNTSDTIQLVTASTGANHLNSGVLCRLILVWMGALASSNGSVSWDVPDSSYRWQAGTGNGNLVSAFQQHLTNDISFLLQRPYLLAYQSNAQTGLSNNVFHSVTMDTIAGIVHGSAGDNYGGWNSGSNSYVAPVAGWYLVAGGYKQSPLTSTASCRACIYQSPQGNQTPDWYQYISANGTPAVFPGAEALGLYYLRAGDSVQPQYQQQGGGSTFSTISNAHTGHACTFSVVWVCS